MRKSYAQKLADQEFQNLSFNSLEDLLIFKEEEERKKATSIEEKPFEERNLLFEIIEENKNKKVQAFIRLKTSQEKTEPMINGIPLSKIVKGEVLLETTESLRNTTVNDYTVVLRQVGGPRSKRYSPSSKHKLRIAS